MPSGILLLDKPLGLSSNAALQKVRRALGANKAGHVGTLDPLATGMLPICLDEATKVISDIESGDKAYDFTIGLGARTATGDLEGAVVERAPLPSLDAMSIGAVLPRFRGAQLQIPPMYSAIKRDGRPLYELARAGQEVERNPRPVTIREIGVIDIRPAEIDLTCICSKGTYVRTLAEDIARALGTQGHVRRLRRLWVEPFGGRPMASLLGVLDNPAEAIAALLPSDAALPHLPAVELATPEVARCLQGQAVAAKAGASATIPIGTRLRIYAEGGAFLGIGEQLANRFIRPRRLLAPSGVQAG